MDNNLSLLPSVLKRRALSAAVTLVSAMAVGLAYGLLAKPTYETSTRFVIDNQAVSVSELGQAITDVQSSIPSGANLLATQSELSKSEKVLQRALEQLTVDLGSRVESLTVLELRKDLVIKVIPATNILKLSFSLPDLEVVTIALNRSHRRRGPSAAEQYRCLLGHGGDAINPFGDGRAAERIVVIVRAYLGRQALPETPQPVGAS